MASADQAEIKFGILSAAHLHADSYVAQLRHLNGVRLVGIWDDNPDRREQKAAEYACAAMPDVDALLEQVDAVIVCAENVFHRPLTEQAAQAGKHVLCEKPLATTPEDARAMVETCARAGVQLMTAFPCRFSPAFVQLKAMVENGEIGEVLAVRGTNRGRCPGGWFIQKHLSGGGAVMDHTVHVTDLLRALLKTECKTVFCEADNRLLHGDFDDTGFLQMTFDNEVFATLDASWSRPKSFPTWGDVTLCVVGTAGSVELDMFAQESVLYSDQTGSVSYQGWGSNIDDGLVRAFLHAVRSGEEVPITGVDGLRAVEVVAAAYESVSTHQPAPVRHLSVDVS
ncbi:MAG: Gfo/Idh/MocA family oxidoreductase [Armatimonadaceae bacterium]